VRTGVAGYAIATPAGCKHSQFFIFIFKTFVSEVKVAEYNETG